MKLSIDKVKMMPPHVGNDLCVYGQPSEEVRQWCDHHGIGLAPSGSFTDLTVPDDLHMEDIFLQSKTYEYLDGFSPNLNKHLHLGHLSNLVLAKAFQSLGVAKKAVAILGDTLDGQVTQKEALDKFKEYCSLYNYKVDGIYFASHMQLQDERMLVEGTGDYEGTKVFDINGSMVVGVKSTGATTYFYQDVAFAQLLGDSTLYLTGSEQKEHFALLKQLFPQNDHVGLGLVLLTGGGKLSSRKGEVIYAHEVFSVLNEMFNDDQASFNVLAGQILKSDPKSTKSMNMQTIGNPKTSMGLYISYTTARLKSAGVEPLCSEKFASRSLGYAYVKAMTDKAPHHLFNALVEYCKVINSLYADKENRIVGNEANRAMFTKMMMDLELGLKKLGLFSVEKINRPEDGVN